MRETNEAILVIALMATTLVLIGEANAQPGGNQNQRVRQIPAPLPKLALNGAAGETKGGVHHQRIVLMITNWERYSAEMFVIPTGRRLPPNPCSEVSSRVVISVYSERGAPLSACIPIPKPSDLGKFSFPIQKGKPVPEFIYAVIHDRYTGGAYRSNLVSPSSSHTK